MAHTRILKVLSIDQVKGVTITTAVDTDGNVVTGVGEFKDNDPIITFFDDRYNRPKFMPDSS